ncbi:Peptidase M24, structural domain [Pseudocohnilembus persalinus]|uniref:FACT complex subunit n=1 Tax=Pseudocohnilembus persalinus TaxID=266149 RepID=A0A0V0Q7D8_PSEPJ|nr:Peptidase M24, structural domain [Pseudocohnilembus persalinus]|eukprot:KRW98162.1 Peptidase M24, structural domain [Pseudocohnilembus persalinus]
MQFIEKVAGDNQEGLQQLYDLIKKDTGANEFKIGQLEKEEQQGPLDGNYKDFMKLQTSHQFVDCTQFIQETLLVKDNQELGLIEKQGEQERIKNKYGVDPNSVDFSYLPVIQSGGQYNLQAAQPNNNKLEYDTIIASLGMSYNQYNSNLSRTLFIDPNEEQKEVYQAVKSLHTKIIKEFIKPDKQISDIHKQIVDYLKDHIPQIPQSSYPSNFGQGIGLLFKENLITISENCERITQPGMVLNINTGFSGLKAGNKNYAILIQDTIILTKQESFSITTQISSDLDDISYSIDDQSDEEEKQNGENQRNSQKRQDQGHYATRRTRGRQNQATVIDQETYNKRKQHQVELRKIKLDEMKIRLENDGFSSSKKKDLYIELEKVNTYKQQSDFPENIKPNQIYIDSKRNALLLPVNGSHVPINVNIVKNCSKQDEGNKTFSLRLNLQYPGLSLGLAGVKFPVLPDENVFIRELTFKSKNEQRINDNIKKIKELQKKVKQVNLEKQQREELVAQDNIIPIRGKRPVLKDLKIRPPISAKKSNGQLECHQNGFKYVTQRGETCDIIFSNIKHAFFQPCDFEMIIVLHFHLKNPLIINKKKTYDVQFFTEVGVGAVDLNQKRRTGMDDDYDDEEQEKLMRKKLNKDFKLFIRAIQEIDKDSVNFERPYRDLGFDGAPNRATCFLQPTNSCLINVIDSPQFILTLEEVELCCFERMMPSLKNFDLVFLFKDYDKPVQRITAIPMNKAEEIKNWLDQMEIIFFESTRAIAWTTIMGEIKKDIEGFVEDGGWEPVLEDEDGEEDEDSALEGDSDFESVSSAEEEEYDEDDSQFGSSASLVSEDDSGYDEESELSESGQSWSQLEKQAARDDEQKARMKRQEANESRGAGGRRRR